MNVPSKYVSALRPIAGGTRLRPPRALGMVLAVVLLTALLLPLTAPSAAAFQDGGAGENGGVVPEFPTGEEAPLDEETPPVDETPVPEDPALPDEVPVAEETPAAEEMPDAGVNGLQADPYAGRIIVFIRQCADAYGNDFRQLDANCKGLEGHQFDVYGVDNAGKGLQQTGTNYLDVSGIGGGQYTIRSFTPEDYRSPAVFCSRGAYGSPQGAYDATVTVDGYYEFNLAPGERIACHWFYVPRVTGYGSLTLGFSTCPPAEVVPIENFDYGTATVSQLVTVCSLYKQNPVPFLLYSHADGFSLKMYTSPSTGIAAWGTMAAGGQTLSTDPMPNYRAARMFCYLSSDPANIFETTVDGWSAQVDVQKNGTTYCDWFNIPAPSSAATVGGVVTVSAYDCDGISEDIDPYAAGRDELVAACRAQDGDELKIALSAGADGETAVQPIASGTDGSLSWSQVPAGDLTVTGLTAGGSGEAVVFCSTSNPATLVFEVNYAKVPVEDGAFGYRLNKDYSLSCDVFAIPGGTDGADTGDGETPDGQEGDVADAGTGTVSIVAYACPKDIKAQGSFDGYAAACTALREGAVFKLDGARSGNPGEQSTGADGAATWSNREADRYFLTEQDTPAGYESPAVFCDAYVALDGLVPDYAAHEVSAEGRIAFDLTEGESMSCSWFGLLDTENAEAAS